MAEPGAEPSGANKKETEKQEEKRYVTEAEKKRIGEAVGYISYLVLTCMDMGSEDSKNRALSINDDLRVFYESLVVVDGRPGDKGASVDEELDHSGMPDDSEVPPATPPVESGTGDAGKEQPKKAEEIINDENICSWLEDVKHIEPMDIVNDAETYSSDKLKELILEYSEDCNKLIGEMSKDAGFLAWYDRKNAGPDKPELDKLGYAELMGLKDSYEEESGKKLGGDDSNEGEESDEEAERAREEQAGKMSTDIEITMWLEEEQGIDPADLLTKPDEYPVSKLEELKKQFTKARDTLAVTLGTDQDFIKWYEEKHHDDWSKRSYGDSVDLGDLKYSELRDLATAYENDAAKARDESFEQTKSEFGEKMERENAAERDRLAHEFCDNSGMRAWFESVMGKSAEVLVDDKDGYGLGVLEWYKWQYEAARAELIKVLKNSKEFAQWRWNYGVEGLDDLGYDELRSRIDSYREQVGTKEGIRSEYAFSLASDIGISAWLEDKKGIDPMDLVADASEYPQKKLEELRNEYARDCGELAKQLMKDSDFMTWYNSKYGINIDHPDESKITIGDVVDEDGNLTGRSIDIARLGSLSYDELQSRIEEYKKSKESE